MGSHIFFRYLLKVFTILGFPTFNVVQDISKLYILGLSYSLSSFLLIAFLIEKQYSHISFMFVANVLILNGLKLALYGAKP